MPVNGLLNTDITKMSHDEENALIAERRRKLHALRESGIAYPNDFRRDALAEELHQTHGAKDNDSLETEVIAVSVAGRMMAKRVMGKASFAKLQDRSGQIQLFVQRNSIGEDVYEAFRHWDVGDIVAAEGRLFKTKTGELSVWVERLRLMTKSLRPLPEKFHGLSDQEQRYRQRYVDLIMNEGSREVFRLRSRIVKYIRDYLDTLGFQEVETPMMHAIPGGALARPFVTHHNALDMKLYLRIAPELYLKRLVVGGFERVYEINRSFRNEGVSTQHNPEFTMLEVYMAYADFNDQMELVESMIHGLAGGLMGGGVCTYQDREVDLGSPFRRQSLEEAVLEANPAMESERCRDVAYLREVCDGLGIHVENSWGAGKLLTEVFEKTVEPGLWDPTFITGFPTEVSPLARSNDLDPFITDRFELFLTGREIANGFSELNDPEEQARRFSEQVASKDAGDLEAMYFDNDYIRALEYGLPPTAGLGVGIDRLAMLLSDSASIRDVLLFPHMRPEQ
jgi:lysyl-tRNA synthetase class 2